MPEQQSLDIAYKLFGRWLKKYTIRDGGSRTGIQLPLLLKRLTLYNVQFVKYDVTVSFMAQVLDTVTYLVPQVLDTAS